MPHTYRAFGLEPIGTWVKRLDTPMYKKYLTADHAEPFA
jgi:hypothetical protein